MILAVQQLFNLVFTLYYYVSINIFIHIIVLKYTEKSHIIVTVYSTVYKLTLNMREICAAVYGLVMSRSNFMEPLQKAIWVTFRVAISVFDTANSVI